jgi:hypothetical protein
VECIPFSKASSNILETARDFRDCVELGLPVPVVERADDRGRSH